MYDELVKELRVAGDFVSLSGYQRDLMRKAADAIEELSKYANTIMRLKSEGWYLQQTKNHNGYEAITTMPIPKPPKEEEG